MLPPLGHTHTPAMNQPLFVTCAPTMDCRATPAPPQAVQLQQFQPVQMQQAVQQVYHPVPAQAPPVQVMYMPVNQMQVLFPVYVVQQPEAAQQEAASGSPLDCCDNDSSSNSGNGLSDSSVPTSASPPRAHPKKSKLRVKPSTVLRVSGHTPLGSLAGAVAKRLRQNHTVEVEAMGPTTVSLTMNALHLAGTFLRNDGFVLSSTSSFMQAESPKGRDPHPGLRYSVSVCTGSVPPKPAIRMTITETCPVGKTAGSIAKLIRQAPPGGDRAFGVLAGPSPAAINIAAKAIALAHTMLTEEGQSFCVTPFIQEGPPSRDPSALCLIIGPAKELL